MEPLWRISAATYKLARTIIFSVIGVVAVSLILAMFLSNNLSKPIKEITRIIESLSGVGTAKSQEVKERATELVSKTVEAGERTENVYTEVKERAEHAIESANAIRKINEMYVSVHGIADHTSNMMDKIKDNDSYISGSTRSVSNLENIVKEFSL